MRRSNAHLVVMLGLFTLAVPLPSHGIFKKKSNRMGGLSTSEFMKIGTIELFVKKTEEHMGITLREDQKNVARGHLGKLNLLKNTQLLEEPTQTKIIESVREVLEQHEQRELPTMMKKAIVKYRGMAASKRTVETIFQGETGRAATEDDLNVLQSVLDSVIAETLRAFLSGGFGGSREQFDQAVMNKVEDKLRNEIGTQFMNKAGPTGKETNSSGEKSGSPF